MTRTRDADVRGFSAREIGYLSKLPAVEHVTRGRIVYAEDFKNHCVRRYLSGDSPAQIFRMAGLDSSLIGYKAHRTVHRPAGRIRTVTTNGCSAP